MVSVSRHSLDEEVDACTPLVDVVMGCVMIDAVVEDEEEEVDVDVFNLINVEIISSSTVSPHPTSHFLSSKVLTRFARALTVDFNSSKFVLTWLNLLVVLDKVVVRVETLRFNSA